MMLISLNRFPQAACLLSYFLDVVVAVQHISCFGLSFGTDVLSPMEFGQIALKFGIEKTRNDLVLATVLTLG